MPLELVAAPAPLESGKSTSVDRISAANDATRALDRCRSCDTTRQATKLMTPASINDIRVTTTMTISICIPLSGA